MWAGVVVQCILLPAVTKPRLRYELRQNFLADILADLPESWCCLCLGPGGNRYKRNLGYNPNSKAFPWDARLDIAPHFLRTCMGIARTEWFSGDHDFISA